LRRVCEEAVSVGVSPGLVVVVGAGGRNLLHDAFGHRQTDPVPLPATPDTIYDLASLTKALVTSLLYMRAVAAGQLRLSDSLLDQDGPTIRQTLAHAGGFAAHRPFHERVAAGDPARRARIVELAAAEPRAYPAGTRSIYSDLGFILLGDRLERLLGARLDALAAEMFAPLGLPSLRFGAGNDGPVAPTQRSAARGRLIVGEVDDLNAWAMDGVAGHAGLFGNAADVSQLAHALCAAWRDGSSLIEAPVLREFWTPAGVPGSTWRLGWDGPAPAGSLAGELISRRAVGHLAFTGCSLWIDPERETFVLVLCNRVHPAARDDPRFKALRPALNDAALEGAGYRS
jgi:CubicO group peptidase (beta-lactamase class C family)